MSASFILILSMLQSKNMIKCIVLLLLLLQIIFTHYDRSGGAGGLEQPLANGKGDWESLRRTGGLSTGPSGGELNGIPHWLVPWGV